MDISTLFQISGSALSVQKRRMEVVAENLAGAEITRTAEGTPYRRKVVVLESFGAHLDRATGQSVPDIRATVHPDPTPFQKVHEPGHPDADENGYVEKPNVNVMEEMINMISASRSYEANTKAIDATKAMARQAMQIGR